MSVNDSFFESQEVQLLKKELFGLNDVYRDIADEIGIENTFVIYKLFHGTQVSCDIIGGNFALLVGRSGKRNKGRLLCEKILHLDRIAHGINIGNIANGENVTAVSTLDIRSYRLGAHRQNEVIVGFFIGSACAEIFDGDGFGIGIDLNRLV